MKESMVFKDKSGKIVKDVDDAVAFELTKFDDNGSVILIQSGYINDNEKEIKDQKQNMTLGDIVTPNSLDTEVERILGSLEDDVLSSLKKTKYFDKVPEE